MATKTEGQHAAEFILSQAQGWRSFEAGTVLSGQNLVAGSVIGAVAFDTTVVAAAVAGNTGNGTMGTVTPGAGAKVGVYKLTIIEPASDAGAFVVEDPDGITVGHGTVAVAFSGGGLGFTLADGATNFVAGDQFTMTVAAGSLKWKLYNPANTDGSEVPIGILVGAVDASSADKKGVRLARDAEVKAADLVWFADATTDQKNAALAILKSANNIIARS